MKVNIKIKMVKKAFLVLFLTMFFGACKKYLDKKSDNSLAIPESVTIFKAYWMTQLQ